jgi:peptide/nickel transport system permease protein
VTRYIIKRILQAVPMLVVISIVCFALIEAAPFDAIDMIARPDMSAELVLALRAKAGLDQPAYIRFCNWLGRVFQGDLGYSIVTHQSVAFELKSRLPNTVLLILPSYTLALLISLVLGLIAGAKHGKLPDRLIDGICSVGMATPTFWVGMIFLYIFAYSLNIFPVLGLHTLGREADNYDMLRHLVLPWVTLMLAFLPDTTRYVRSSAIGEYDKDYVTVQRAFGAGEIEILFKHVLKNVMLPVITIVGMALPMLVTGAFVTESIFSLPGVGVYFLAAIKAFDYPVIMSVLLFSSTAVIVGNLLADICYCLVDPRIRQMD